MDTVPKTMQAKARRLMEYLKRDVAWTARGELIHEGVPVVGSNVVNLVNDLLRKRKTDPTGWQPFARQLGAINLPMALVGNVARRTYVRQATTATPSRRSAATTPRAAGSARTVGHPSLVSAVEWNIPCPPYPPNHARLCRHWLVGTIYKVVRCVSVAQCSSWQPIHRTRTVPSSLRYFVVDYLIAHGIAQILMQQALFRLWFRY